jgi:hypothetical protein
VNSLYARATTFRKLIVSRIRITISVAPSNSLIEMPYKKSRPLFKVLPNFSSLKTFKYDIENISKTTQMPNFQNPITTTRLPKEGTPVFELEDAFHLGSPNPSPYSTSSMQCEPTSSHRDWNIVMPRLGPEASRSPTPDIDLFHPRQDPRRTALLDSKPGVLRGDNSYISRWECCKVWNPLLS